MCNNIKKIKVIQYIHVFVELKWIVTDRGTLGTGPVYFKIN